VAAPEDRHDPGGKVRLRLPEGVAGEAAFSDCGRYRQALIRAQLERILATPSLSRDTAEMVGRIKGA